METLEIMNHLRQSGWCLNIFIPSGQPTAKHQVLISYDNGGDIFRCSAPTLEAAVADVLQATEALPA
jgi:hypothetical protein